MKLYSITQIKNYCKNNKKDFSIERFFCVPRMVYLKGGYLFISGDDIKEFNMSKYKSLDINRNNLILIIDYNDFLKTVSVKKIKDIIDTKRKLDIEGKYLERSFEAVKNSSKIVSLDCEFNRDKITEIGLFVIDVDKNTFDTIHYCLNKENTDSFSPFKNPYALSLGNPIYLDSFDEIKEKIENIINGSDMVVGHAIKNDLDVLKKNNFKIKKRKVIDTQKLLYKVNNGLLSLSDGVDLYNVRIHREIGDKEILGLVNNIREEFKVSHKNFIDKNLIGDLFIHNALNDCVCTMFLMDSIYRKEFGYNCIEDILHDRIIMQVKNNYLINLENFNKHFKKVRKMKNERI